VTAKSSTTLASPADSRRITGAAGLNICGVTQRKAMTDQERRKKLAALSFSEKIRILEKLRDRSVMIAKAGLRKKSEPTKNPK